LNISRIFTFAIALLILRVAVGIVVAGFPGHEEADSQLVLQYLAGYALDAAVVIAVFARLGRVQINSPYLHAFLVVALQELLGAALIFVIGQDNPDSPLWLIDWAVLAASVLLGTEFGRRLRLARVQRDGGS
jgi:hypothetical protein